MIRDFKLWCASQDLAVPANDEEIMRVLYARKFKNKIAYDTLVASHQFEAENFPYKIREGVRTMIEQGIFYLAGRDKCFRPVYVCQISKLLQMKPPPEPEDIIAMIIQWNELVENFMLIPGQIENRIIIVDCKDLWVWNIASTVYTLKNAIGGLQS